jgi:formylglycine-generating enzyme required for sulfatase activity/serine/threonine protein kinase
MAASFPVAFSLLGALVATATSAALLSLLHEYRLLEPAQLEEAEYALAAHFTDPKALQDELVQLGCLTAYQLDQIAAGKAAELRLGPYVILERLGEGGMGTVLKARHDKMGRVDALKIIRKERLNNPEALKRFEREVRAAAQLHHPNIVQTYYADDVSGTHFLAMEFIPGKDLRQVVKDRGPLPVAEACDYVRQVANGLAHARAKGLVHRDIKPANLLLMEPQASGPAALPNAGGEFGVVKILDMGIARVIRVGEHTLTPEGAIVGSFDYIAPEQARESRTVDIRADLYSLGCTFYFLLTGQVPFPRGEAAEKLLKHQLEEPVPVEQLRSEVPPAVAAMVRTLMAKRPEDRYQTPEEVVTALMQRLAHHWPHSPANAPQAPRLPVELASTSTDAQATKIYTKPQARPAHRPRLRRRVVIGGLVALAIIIGSVVWLGRPPRPVVVEIAANQPWQDTGVDVVEGQEVVLVPEGIWRKGDTKSTAMGLESSPRELAVLPEAPLLCLLVRVGDEATPSPVVKGMRFTARRSGRLYLQANDLGLADNSGTLKVAVDGGLPAEGEAPEPGLLPIQRAEQEVRLLLERGKDPAVKPEQLRDAIIEFCLTYPTFPQSYRAGALLPKLPRWKNSVGMELAPIPPGKFRMGSPDNELGRHGDGREGPQHEVTLTRPFYIGVYPVTVGQFREFVKARTYQTGAETSGGAWRRGMDGRWVVDPTASWLNPGFDQTDECPVVCVDWNDAQRFCAWLTKKEGKPYTLPTEAQWEYGCRAGSSTKYFFGKGDQEADRYLWHNGNSEWKTHPVGTKERNAWGLYDMGGNVRNWCQDIYDKDYYQVSPKEDPAGANPTGLSERDRRVLRGGNWYYELTYGRSAYRNYLPAGHRISHGGFRVVLMPAPRGRVDP